LTLDSPFATKANDCVKRNGAVKQKALAQRTNGVPKIDNTCKANDCQNSVKKRVAPRRLQSASQTRQFYIIPRAGESRVANRAVIRIKNNSSSNIITLPPFFKKNIPHYGMLHSCIKRRNHTKHKKALQLQRLYQTKRLYKQQRRRHALFCVNLSTTVVFTQNLTSRTGIRAIRFTQIMALSQLRPNNSKDLLRRNVASKRHNRRLFFTACLAERKTLFRQRGNL